MEACWRVRRSAGLVIGALQATRVRDPPGGVPVIVGGTARVQALLARGAAERVGELSFRRSRQCSLAPGTRLPTALGWTAMATHLAGRSWHRRRHGADVRA